MQIYVAMCTDFGIMLDYFIRRYVDARLGI